MPMNLLAYGIFFILCIGWIWHYSIDVYIVMLFYLFLSVSDSFYFVPFVYIINYFPNEIRVNPYFINKTINANTRKEKRG